MRSVDDLRRVLTAVTADLAPTRSPEQIAAAGRRRLIGQRALVAGVAGVATLVAAAIPVWVWPNASGRPAPPGASSSPTTAPTTDGAIYTGIPTDNGEELVLTLTLRGSIPLVEGSRRDATTGRLKPILQELSGDPGSVPAAGFAGSAATTNGLRGTVIQYGAVKGPVDSIVARACRSSAEAACTRNHPGSMTTLSGVVRPGVARSSSHPEFGVYWVPDLPVGAEGTLVAMDRDRVAIGTTSIHAVTPNRKPPEPSTESFETFDPSTAPRIGKMVRTGAMTAEGGELVMWFVGNDKGAVLKTGRRNGRTGKVTDTSAVMFVFERPPTLRGFDSGGYSIEGPAGTTIHTGAFVGPVKRMTATAGRRTVAVHFAHWSAHPELVLYWVTGLRQSTGPRVTAYDAAGNVIGRR